MRLLVCFLFACAPTAVSNSSDVREAQQVGLLDVSILYPLTGTMDDYIAGAELLPKVVFDGLEIEGLIDYARLRVVALRLDPCFASKCESQMRLTLQPMLAGDGSVTTEDDALHLFFSLEREELLALVDRIVAARAASGGSGAGPLRAHPLLATQGLRGPFATTLAALIRETATPQRLSRLAMMVVRQSDDFWKFRQFSVAGDTLKKLKIPGINDDKQGLESTHSDQTVHISFEDGPADELAYVLSSLSILQNLEAIGSEKARAAVDLAFAIENPSRHNAESTDCGSCHTVGLSREMNARVSATADNANKFVRPEGIADEEMLPTVAYAPTGPGDNPINLHMFSYRHGVLAIAQRTINETAAVVSFLRAR